MFVNMKRAEKVMVQAVLSLMAALWLYPMIQAFLQSMRVNGFGNYIAVLNHPKIDVVRVVGNSFLVAIVTGLIVTFLATAAAYAFSKMRFAFSGALYYMLLLCLTIPAASVLGPLFLTVKTFGLMNTYWAIILPMAAFQAPFSLLIIKNYYDTIPNELLEAASIDGSSRLSTFRHIMLPLGLPAMVNIIVLSFINSWNEYLIPLVFIQKSDMFTVTLATTFFTGTTFQTPEMVAQLYAVLVLMTLPSIIIYLISQKYLQEGLTAGAVKS